MNMKTAALICAIAALICAWWLFASYAAVILSVAAIVMTKKSAEHTRRRSRRAEAPRDGRQTVTLVMAIIALVGSVICSVLYSVAVLPTLGAA